MKVSELTEISNGMKLELNIINESLSFINGYFLIRKEKEYKEYIEKNVLKTKFPVNILVPEK